MAKETVDPKDDLIGWLTFGVKLLKHYCKDPKETYIDEQEMGGNILWTISENSVFLYDAEVKTLFDHFVELLREFVRRELRLDRLRGLADIFYAGRDSWPDKKKYWWWWLPEKLMPEEQRKRWDELLAKYPNSE